MKLSKIKYIYEILSVIVGASILAMNFLFIAESLPFIAPLLNVLGGLIAVVPPVWILYSRYKKGKQVEQQFVIFIRDLTDSINSGMTLPTALEEAQMKAAKFLAKLDQINLDEIVGSLDKTVSGLDRLVNSPKLAETIDTLPQAVKNIDAAVGQLQDTFASIQGLSEDFRKDLAPLTQQIQVTAEGASQTMDAARATLQSVQAFVDPESPVVYQLGQALTDLAQASAAIRRFAEALERNPSMLVRGKATTEGER